MLGDIILRRPANEHRFEYNIVRLIKLWNGKTTLLCEINVVLKQIFLPPA